MLGALPGVAAARDELAIAVVALVVPWVAVKHAGRKLANGDDDERQDVPASTDQEIEDPAK